MLETRRLQQAAEVRRGESICEFARAFNLRRIDPLVVRAVFEELEAALERFVPGFPIRASDRLKEDLGLHHEDMDLDVVPVSVRTRDVAGDHVLRREKEAGGINRAGPLCSEENVAQIEYRLGLRERTRMTKMLRAAFLWLAFCGFGGLLLAIVWGELGSVIVAFMGAIFGLCGALACFAITLLQHFRLLQDRNVGAANWILAMSLFGAIELVWRWTLRDAVMFTPIAAAIAAPLSYAVNRIYATKQNGEDHIGGP